MVGRGRSDAGAGSVPLYGRTALSAVGLHALLCVQAFFIRHLHGKCMKFAAYSVLGLREEGFFAGRLAFRFSEDMDCAAGRVCGWKGMCMQLIAACGIRRWGTLL